VPHSFGCRDENMAALIAVIRANGTALPAIRIIQAQQRQMAVHASLYSAVVDRVPPFFAPAVVITLTPDSDSERSTSPPRWRVNEPPDGE